ncbi:hypothetical protein TIFTF001_016011 [Ficus carica]|uniref:Uncharacterized protein n=1 Tax=Ficus carica TaxID=3494 RepID=A0AA88A6R0_FICCA|nr:hypothetical protein TIFTF001_016011 [Ficus carica]
MVRKTLAFGEIDQEIEISVIDSGAEALLPLVEVLPTVNMSFLLTYDNIILKVNDVPFLYYVNGV